MAIDEQLLSTGPHLEPILRIYSWSRPALSIGCLQRLAGAEPGWEVVRRPTGGGHVEHGADLTYTLVFPPTHQLASGDRFTSYERVHQAVALALAELELKPELAAEEQHDPAVPREDMHCFHSPARYDVLAADGAKLAGAAQRRTRSGTLHQGSIQISHPGAVDALLISLVATFDCEFALYTPPSGFIAEAEALAVAKFANPDWTGKR
ncbi:MAG: lipoate-protein ligase A [Rhodothermales bacterium]|jgi:lipoate-protein ligase A